MAMDESAPNEKSKSRGFLSHMRAQVAVCATQIVEPTPAIPATTDLEATTTMMAVHEPPPEPSLEQPLPPLIPVQAGVSVPATEVVTTAVHEPTPASEPSLEQPPHLFVPAQAQAPIAVPAAVTHDTTLLELGSDLSEIEPGVSEMPRNSKKKSLTPKGRRKVTGSEGGPSKHKSGRKKAGSNA